MREALTRLAQEGYVSLLPNRGFTCKEIRLQEADELYQLREALEAFAVEDHKNLPGGIRRAVGKINAYGKDVQKRFTRDRLVYDKTFTEIARSPAMRRSQRHSRGFLADHFEANRRSL